MPIQLIQNILDPFIKNRYGDDALQTACLKGAVQIFDYLLDNLDYSNQRKAEAFELLGTTFLDEHFDLRLTIKYWKKALDIRCENKIHKTINLRPHPVFLCPREFWTVEDLNSIANDLDAMRMHSLLISERILGPMHKEMIFRLMYRGAAYADSLQYKRCVSLVSDRHKPETQFLLLDRFVEVCLRTSNTQRYSSSQRSRFRGTCFGMFLDYWFKVIISFHSLQVRLFLDLSDKHLNYIREELQYSDVYETIEMIIKEFEACQKLLKIRPVFKKHMENFDKLLKVSRQLL